MRCKNGSPAPRKIGFLTTEELQIASYNLFKFIQHALFKEEIHNLKENLPISSKSSILQFNPFLDSFGVLRVGGRIVNAAIPYNPKHPIILPDRHPVTDLIIRDCHITHLHAGPALLLSILRQSYWILRCKDRIRLVIRKCLICFRQNLRPTEQLMGNPPVDRVNFTRPFLSTGVDYAGPITLKVSKRRGAATQKGYIAVFVCLSTKAVHLELASDQTTDAFMAALKRFTSRRGLPTDLYSDNGTNFVGAKNLLPKLHQLLKSESHHELVTNLLLQDGVNWHFIPPGAPHFGGLWEAAVRSTKFHLVRVIGSTILTFEEYTTLLCQIEAVLNSRPLCELSSEDLDALTPAHFLVGHPLTCVPEPSLNDIKVGRLDRWQMVQQMVQGFWKRWHKEYLTSLQPRTKWYHKAENIKINDLVIIMEPNLPPTKWALGRVVEVHPGKDQLTRVVTLRSRSGLLKRPIGKIFKLPVDIEPEDSRRPGCLEETRLQSETKSTT